MNRFSQGMDLFDLYEMRVAKWMEQHGDTLLRVAMAIVFVWFGALKPFGLSPAEQLVLDTSSWIPVPNILWILGAWEVAIGLCFLFRRTIRVALILLFMHMPGTMLPLIMLPEDSYEAFPFVLTVEGQYIIKNLVLIAAAIVIGGKLRHRMSGALASAPDSFHSLLRRGRWGTAPAGELLTQEGVRTAEVFFIRSGTGEIRMGDRPVGRLRRDQFIGEMSFLSNGVATATVEVTETVEYIAWTKEELRELFDDEQDFQHAMQVSMNLDLTEKLRRANESDEAVASL